MINIGFQILFLIIFYVIGSSSSLAMQGVWKHIALIALVLIPSLIWTIFFYLQDRVEPEPTGYVLLSFLGGMAAAILFALPLENTIFHLSDWMYLSMPLLVFGSLIVIGGIASFMVYLVVRYGFYPTVEFDEPADGMVYGAFVGAGYACIRSLSYLSHHLDFTLFSIAYTAAANILVYASVGAIVGYFIGQAKFAKGNVQAGSVIGIIVGMVLIGIYHVLNEFVLLRGTHHTFWFSFLLTVVFAILLLSWVSMKIKKLTTGSIAQDKPLPLKADPVVWLLFVVMLIVGGFIKSDAMKDKVFTDAKDGIQFHYPARMSQLSSFDISGAALTEVPVRTIFKAAGEKNGRFTISVKVQPGSVNFNEINVLDYLPVRETLSFEVHHTTVAGKECLRMKYSFLEKSSTETTAFPMMHWAVTDLVESNGKTFIFTYLTYPQNFYQNLPVYQNILNTIQWSKS